MHIIKHPFNSLFNHSHARTCVLAAKEHKKKQQSHTYINIRPGHRPFVVTTKDGPLSSGTAVQGGRVSNGTSKMSRISHKSASPECGREDADTEVFERRRDDGTVGKPKERESLSRREKTEASVVVSGNHETLAPSLMSEKEAGNSASPQMAESCEEARHYDSLSPESPPNARQRPLVVHNYENFPFNPTRERRRSSDTDAGGVAATPPPTRSRTGSDVSNASSAPPLPERHYSESDVSGSSARGLPDHTLSSPSPAPIDPQGTLHDQATSSEGGDTLSPLRTKHSRSHEVQREMSEQGNEYAVINPAWKKNVKGRSPSLTRIDDNDVSVETDAAEAPPNSAGAGVVESSMCHSGRGTIDLDSDLVKQKRDELEVSSRFTQSVKYAEVQIGSGVKPPTVLENNSDPGYDSIDNSKLLVKGE